MIGLDALLRDMVSKLTPQQAELQIGHLSLDSRTIGAGDVFIALAGEQHHGIEFADQALAAGAAVVLHDGEHPVPNDPRYIQIHCLSSRLAAMAKRCWQDPAADLELMAVTGTNGKSSVAWLLAQALDGGMIGTLGSGRPSCFASGTHTTPDLLSLYRTLAALKRDGMNCVVLEASSHALDQQRMAGLSFNTAIFTNLGHDHLDYHGNVDRYAEAKGRLFREFNSRHQLIGIDDPFGRELANELSDRPGLIRYGLERKHGPDVWGEIRQANLDGQWIDLTLPMGRLTTHTRLIGRVNALNVMVVAAVLAEREFEPEAIA
ncbi:MAG: Mur ligase family protein [Pseudomonadota bacterium]